MIMDQLDREAEDKCIDYEIYKQESIELHDLASLLVNRSPRFAFLIVECWLESHHQNLTDKTWRAKP
jgi:frataxin-like iron-binding protein CyaY